MALPDSIRLVPATEVIWGESGASGVTKAMALNALANGAARMGAVQDLGASLEQLYWLQLIIETGTAPTAGGVVELYLACTNSVSRYPAGVTGSDGAYKAGEESEWLNQLGRAPDLVLVVTNDTNVSQVSDSILWAPRGRYVVPIVRNSMGQGVRNEATATNNDSRVILTPLSVTVQD